MHVGKHSIIQRQRQLPWDMQFLRESSLLPWVSKQCQSCCWALVVRRNADHHGVFLATTDGDGAHSITSNTSLVTRPPYGKGMSIKVFCNYVSETKKRIVAGQAGLQISELLDLHWLTSKRDKSKRINVTSLLYLVFSHWRNTTAEKYPFSNIVAALV